MRHYALAIGMAGTSPAMTLEIQSCLSVRFGFDFQTARARGACPIRAKDALHRPCCYDGAGAPEVLSSLRPDEGARNAGCANASAAPCANDKKHTSIVATVTPFSSGVPHAVGGTACCVRHPRWPVLSTPPLCGLTDSSIALCTRSDGVVLPLGAKPMRRDDTPWAVRERHGRQRGRTKRRSLL